jgi:spermidine/putrescine transport system permease protein
VTVDSRGVPARGNGGREPPVPEVSRPPGLAQDPERARDSAPAASPAAGRGRRRPRRRWGDRLLFAWTWLIIIWLALPIAVMIIFSFNNPHGRFNFTWVGFTLKWYGPHLLDYPSLTTAMENSLIVAFAATVGSVVLGTLVGLALGKYRFRGLGTANLVQFAAISAPDIVLASSLLAFFVTLRVPLGLPTIIVAHIMFCLSFVAVTVRARVLTLDRSLEEAARDLGAGPWATFRLVTLPLIFPGVLAGALLAFAISIDDFVVTSFVSGSTQTFPLWIWSATRNGLPPQVDVLGTLIFVAGLVIAATSAFLGRRGTR